MLERLSAFGGAFWIGCALLLLLCAWTFIDGVAEGARERLILRDLLVNPWAYGLELVERSGGLLKRGTVYVTLGRLEQEGLLDSLEETTTPDHVGIPRRVYTLTDQGRAEALRHMQVFA